MWKVHNNMHKLSIRKVKHLRLLRLPNEYIIKNESVDRTLKLKLAGRPHGRSAPLFCLLLKRMLNFI